MASLAGMTAMDWNAMAVGMAAQQPQLREAARPVLEGLHALACELNDHMALGPATAPALALLESARQFVRGACALGPADEQHDRPANGGLAGWQIRALTQHIDRHLDGKLCLATLAQAVRLSSSYLCRACRQTFQCSPMQYVMQRRLLAATHLLRHSGTALSELALTCGFADQAHFTRVFRSATGETPLRWRRMWQTSGSSTAIAGLPRQSRAQLIL